MLTLNQLKHLYTNAPRWVKNLYASIPYSIRNGSEFRTWYAFVQTQIDTESYQILKLKETLYYAYEHVPYYKKLFDDLQISPFDLHEVSNLKNFPLLTKDIIKNNFKDLNAINYPNYKKFYVKTGGTTGTPTRFHQSKNVWKKELAFVLDFFNRFGYQPTDWKASFKGGDYENLKEDKFWSLDPVKKSISFSPIHLNNNTVNDYCTILNAYQPMYFHTYPSTLLFFIELMKEEQCSLNYHPKAIFLVSEGYDTKDIEKIQTCFHSKIASFYGHSERLLFATSEDHNLQIYHNDKRYGLLELINENNEQIEEIEKNGTLVGTSFDNYAMPLIRYATDDMTCYLDDKQNTIQKITSLRTKIYLDAKNGQKISITSLSISSLTDHIHSFQFYQEKPGSLTLLIVPKKDFCDNEKYKIYHAIYNKIGNIMDISILTITQPKRTVRGKKINVIKNYRSI